MKRKRFIALFVLVVLILTLNISIFFPKTYESESVIQLGSISGDIYSPEEAKNIIPSSVILGPVIEKFFPEEKRPSLDGFNTENLKVEIILEGLSVSNIKQIKYLKITTKAKTAETAEKINSEIISSFFDYVKPEYDKRVELTLDDLINTRENIIELKTDIENTKKEIASLSTSQLSGEGISKSTLLTSILSNYKSRLVDAENKEISLELSLVLKREFKIISQPQIPKGSSSPDLKMNLAIALVLGLCLSIFLSFFIEAIKKK